MRTIYIRLLNEGVEVFRPTSAEEVGDSGFRVLATTPYDPDDEEWEFPPGSIVTCAKRKLEGAEVLVAVAAEKPLLRRTDPPHRSSGFT